MNILKFLITYDSIEDKGLNSYHFIESQFKQKKNHFFFLNHFTFMEIHDGKLSMDT
jgi:hypothetical protein